MKHRGEIVEKAVRESGYSITRLAQKLGVSRRHIYNIFESNKVDWEIILRIGDIIKYDFSKDFKELNASARADIMNDPATVYLKEGKRKGVKELEAELSFWKKRYIDLLERYNEELSSKLSGAKKSK